MVAAYSSLRLRNSGGCEWVLPTSRLKDLGRTTVPGTFSWPEDERRVPRRLTGMDAMNLSSYRFFAGVARVALAKNASYHRSTASTISSIALALSGRHEASPCWTSSKPPVEDTTGSAAQVYQPSLFSIVKKKITVGNGKGPCRNMPCMTGLSFWFGVPEATAVHVPFSSTP